MYRKALRTLLKMLSVTHASGKGKETEGGNKYVRSVLYGSERELEITGER